MYANSLLNDHHKQRLRRKEEIDVKQNLSHDHISTTMFSSVGHVRNEVWGEHGLRQSECLIGEWSRVHGVALLPTILFRKSI